MKTYIHLPLDRRLALAHTAIQNTLDDPELIAFLTPYSYDEDSLREGIELYQTALELHHRAASERGEQIGATATLHESWSTARGRLRDHVALARVALRRLLNNCLCHRLLRIDQVKARKIWRLRRTIVRRREPN